MAKMMPNIFFMDYTSCYVENKLRIKTNSPCYWYQKMLKIQAKPLWILNRCKCFHERPNDAEISVLPGIISDGSQTGGL